MTTFTLTFECDNDAFLQDLPGEVARILRELGREIGDVSMFPGDAHHVRDVNGNTVGRWEIT